MLVIFMAIEDKTCGHCCNPCMSIYSFTSLYFGMWISDYLCVCVHMFRKPIWCLLYEGVIMRIFLGSLGAFARFSCGVFKYFLN